MCQKLGWRIAFFYMTIIAKLFFSFKINEKNKIKYTVKDVFSGIRSNAELKSVIKRVFQGIRIHYYEKLFNAFSSPETLKAFLRTHVESEDLRVIDEGLSHGKGLLLITGHFGGVEFIPAYLSVSHYPVTIVAKFSTEHLRKATIQKANLFGVRLIDPTNTPNIMKAICDNLRENRIVITQCDEIEAWRPSLNTRIEFLGKQIYLDRMTNVLAKRVKCAISFAVMHRNRHSRYEFIVSSLEELSNKFSFSNNMSAGELVLKFLEQYIYKYPQEWYQWQKCAEMKTLDSYKGGVVNLPSFSWWKQSLSKIP